MFSLVPKFRMPWKRRPLSLSRLRQEEGTRRGPVPPPLHWRDPAGLCDPTGANPPPRGLPPPVRDSAPGPAAPLHLRIELPIERVGDIAGEPCVQQPRGAAGDAGAAHREGRPPRGGQGAAAAAAAAHPPPAPGSARLRLSPPTPGPHRPARPGAARQPRGERREGSPVCRTEEGPLGEGARNVREGRTRNKLRYWSFFTVCIILSSGPTGGAAAARLRCRAQRWYGRGYPPFRYRLCAADFCACVTHLRRASFGYSTIFWDEMLI